MFMAITYDKKMLKRLHKIVNGGQKKYALQYALFLSIFYFLIMLGFEYLKQYKSSKDIVIDVEFIGFWLVGSLFMFVVYYIMTYKGYKDQKAMYDETIKYFEKHDPEFLKDLDL